MGINKAQGECVLDLLLSCRGGFPSFQHAPSKPGASKVSDLLIDFSGSFLCLQQSHGGTKLTTSFLVPAVSIECLSKCAGVPGEPFSVGACVHEASVAGIPLTCICCTLYVIPFDQGCSRDLNAFNV